MALSPARMWTLFRAVRVLVYSIATLVSMGIAGIYALLLVRGWKSFSDDERAIVIILLVVYALSTVMTYLMVILRFRLWLDATRLAILIFAQVGGSITFDFFTPSIPCNNLGSVSTCKMVETIAIFTGLSLSGLLSLFALYLAMMHHVPIPVPRPNPEAILALELQLGNDEKREKDLKRASMNSTASAGSVYSQRSQITPYTYSPSPDMIKPQRSPSIRYLVEAPVDQYRPRTPGSVHSLSASQSTTSNSHTIRQAPSPFDYNRSGTPTSLRSAETGATLGSHANRPAPTYDYNPSRTPASLRSAESRATTGSHTNGLAPTYNRDFTRTPGSVRSVGTGATLGSHTNKPAPTYDYSHSRAQGSTGSTETGPSHDSHTARVPPFEHYRAGTPMSVRSVALTSMSSIRTAPRQRYNQNNGIPAPRPLLAPGRNYPPLTQAFLDPISRQATPMTSLSQTSFYTNRMPMMRSPPPPLAPVGPGYSFPQPPVSNYQNGSPTSPAASNLPSERDEPRPPFIASSTPAPRGLQTRLREAIMRSPSPSLYSVRSIDSLPPSPSRNPSVSSVPRSPSPETFLFHNLPTTPQAAVLPARPDLSPAMYTGRYGTPVPEDQRSRFGSVPDINVNDLPVQQHSNQQQRYEVGYQGGPPRDWTISPLLPRADGRVGTMTIDQWRQNLAYTPRPLDSRRM